MRNKYVIAGKIILPACVFIFLSVMGICSLFEKEYMLEIENRKSNLYPEWLDSLWIEGEYQRKVNDAVADQLPLAMDAKKDFYWLRNGVLNYVQKRLYTDYTDYYVHFRNGIYLYGDKDSPYLLYKPNKLDEKLQGNIQTMAKKINDAASRHQDKAFYVYYIERDIDIRYDTKKRTGIYEFLKDNLSLAQNHIACFKVRDFEEYKRDFNKTDHHWQYIGSYKGYKEVFHLLDLDKEGETLNKPITPNSSYGVSDDCPPKLVEGYKPVLISRLYHDSKCRITGTPDKFYDKFYVYVFDYVPMKIIINGEKGEYGNQGESLKNKDIALEFNLKYGTFYGGDEGEIIFDTGRKDRPNILIFGDSFDNAILKLIAGHFNRTYSIDLRNYERIMGKPFLIDKYMKTHKIDKVLFIGSQSFFEQKKFRNF
jgi:hypothetical protein